MYPFGLTISKELFRYLDFVIDFLFKDLALLLLNPIFKKSFLENLVFLLLRKLLIQKVNSKFSLLIISKMNNSFASLNYST